MNADLVTLFAGGGLADVGAKAAGWEPVGAVEWDEPIAAAYAANVDPRIIVGDVAGVDYRPYAGVDAGWASPCCTNASVANPDAQESEDDLRSGAAVERFLREARPRVFALENVWGYRTFRAFQGILSALQALGYRWRYEHLCAADYGVPQTRRRLILRARRDGGPLLPLAGTHAEGGCGGGLFSDHALLPWVGWHEAIEDLLPECPESRLADWQLKRLPNELRTLLVQETSTLATRPVSEPSACVMSTVGAKAALPRAVLVDSAGYDDGAGRIPVTRRGSAPSGTVLANHAGRGPRALLFDGQNASAVDGSPFVRRGEDPALGVFASANHGMPRAVLLANTSDMGLRAGEEPAPAVVGTDSSARPRAVLVDGANGRTNGPVTTRNGEARSFAIAHANRGLPRAALSEDRGYRVVSLTPRCLARFQSVPDSYALPEKRALACRIIGNGVPCLLAQRVMESLR